VDEISRPQLAVYAVLAVAIGLLGARYLSHSGGSSSGTPAAATSGSGGARSPTSVSVGPAGSSAPVVDVTGAVRHPGVVRLRAGARVQEAIRRAGGATRAADLAGVNLAAKVSDGAQVVVPRRGGAIASAAGGAAGAAPAAATPGAPAQPVNLNTATAEQLDALDGVGPTTARKIVEYRTQHGGFGSVDQLDQIPGIGAKKLAALRAKVTV
jgi:competence protein ComEA